MNKKVTFFILLVVTFVTISIEIYALSPSSNVIYQGIDVSEWQGNIDFKKVKDSGVDVVYIRAGQGFSYKDAKFEINYEEAKKMDLKLEYIIMLLLEMWMMPNYK